MKIVSTLFALLLTPILWSQIIGGALLLDQRKMDPQSTFRFEETVTAELVYQIGVNNEGKVVYAQMDGNRSTKISTPAEVRAMKYLKGILFEKGTAYPKIHYGEIRIFLKPVSKAEIKD